MTKPKPLPSAYTGSGVSQLMRELAIGDSFLWISVTKNMHVTAKRIGIKIKTKAQGNGIYKIWRIA